MKTILFYFSFLVITFSSLYAQEILSPAPFLQHSILLETGVFGQTGTRNERGLSISLGYKVRFRNHFIFGTSFENDQSFYRRNYNASDKENKVWSRMSGYSLSFLFGRNLIDRPHHDLSYYYVVNLNYQQYYTKTFSNINQEYVYDQRGSTTYITFPLLLFRICYLYKFTPQQSIGVDLHLLTNIEADFWGDFIGAEFIAIGRLMFVYQYTFPYNKKTSK